MDKIPGQGKSMYTFSAEHLPLSAFRSPPRLLALLRKRSVTENVYVDLPGPQNPYLFAYIGSENE
jgi:hypothetical protein